MTSQEHVLLTPKIALVKSGERVDAISAPDLRAFLKKVAASGIEHIILDLSDTQFMDSSGLSALVSGLKALRKGGGGKLVLVAPNAQVATALKLTMLDRLFPSYESVESARAALEAKS